MAIELATAYVQIIPSTKGLGSAVAKELNGVQAQADKAGKSMGSKMISGIGSKLRAGAIGAGAAAGAVLGRALQKGFGRLDAIEQAETKISALFANQGMNAERAAAATKSAMGDVTAAVKGTAFATSEAADAAAMALAAGVQPGQELTGVLKTIGDTAAFAGKDFAEISPIFTKILNEGRVTGETLAQLGDNAVPAVQALSKELGVSAEEVRKLASDGKISWEQFQSAMDGAIGGSAAEQGETFRGSLKNLDAALGRLGETLLSTPFMMGPQIFTSLGAAVDDVTAKFKAGITYLQTGVDDEGYMFKAFGSREQADDVMATLDSVREKWGEFKAGLTGDDEGATGMFGSLGESIRKIADAVAEALPAIGEITMSLGEAGMGAAAVSLTTALAAIAPVLADILVPILQVVADVMSENQGAVNALVFAFAGMFTVNKVVGPLGVAGKGLKTFGNAVKLTTKHFKLFGVAKTLLGAGFTKLFPNLAKMSGVFAKLGPAVAKVGTVLSGGLAKGLGLAAKGFKALGVAISANPIGAIVAVIAAVVAGLVWFFTKTETGRRVWAEFTEFLSEAWANITQWASETWDRIVEVWQALPEWFSEKWQAVKNTISEAWDGIKETITNAWNSIVEWFTTAWETYKLLVTLNWEIIKAVFSAAWEGIKSLITTVWTTIVSWLTAAWATFTTQVSSLWLRVQAIFSDAWNAIKHTVVSVWQSVADFMASAWASFTSFVSTTWETIKSTISALWDAVRAKIVEVWEAIKAKFTESVAAIKGKLAEFVSAIRDKFNEAVNKMREFPGKVKDVFTNAGRWLFDAGKRIIQGLIDGIKSMVGLVAGAVRSVIPGFAAGAIGLSNGAAFARGGVTRYAGGGREKHVAQIAKAGEWRVWAEDETGGEAYIPLAKSKRRRSTAILADVAQRFGLNLTDRDGAAVSSWTPGGTGPVAGAVQRFADGGIRTAAQFRRFVEGENVDGEQASGSLQGWPYQNYPSDPNAWGDCSYAQGKLAAFGLGLPTSGRKFSTVTQLQWLRTNGANIGKGPEGTFRMGWYDNGGGQFGHTSGTLPDGTNVEMGGGNGGGAIGGGAVPWNHSQFTHWAWIPVKSSDTAGGSGGAGGTSIDESAPTETAVAGAGVDQDMVPLPDDTAAKAQDAGLATDGSDTWSGIAGDLAKTVVSGQVADVLKVFGIPDKLPPILAAGKQLYVQATQDDPDGEKAIAAVDEAADAKIEAEGGDVNVTVESADSEGAETIPQVAPGTVSKGEYKLGADFYLSEIARAAAERGMGFKGGKLATAAMLVEVGDPPKMYASSVDTASQQYPYEAIGSDHDSSGLFQQRNNGAWGDISQRMNARASASMFLNALAKVAGWETMDEGAAVQAVQRSAFPGRYSQKMARAAELMEQFKGKLPGFRRGGMVKGGSSRIKDDVLAMLQNGEMVINRDAVDADPEMAAALNEQGPEAVEAMVIDNALSDVKIAGGAPQQAIDSVLYGAASKVGPAASMAVKGGFASFGASAQAALGPHGSMIPAAETFGVAGDVAGWYAGEVADGIAQSFAGFGSEMAGIGINRVEETLAALGAPTSREVSMSAGMSEFQSVLDESLATHSAGYAQRTGGGDTYQFIAQDMTGMQSMFRREQAKRSRGKVGAR